MGVVIANFTEVSEEHICQGGRGDVESRIKQKGVAEVSLVTVV